MRLNYVVSGMIGQCPNPTYAEQLGWYTGAARYYAYTLRTILPVHILNIKANNIYQLATLVKGISQCVVFMSKVYFLTSAIAQQ